MEELWRDVRYGFRMLVRSPGFTVFALLALGLGIGANTAIFSVVNTVLLRPLPYPDPSRLAMLYQNNLKEGIETDYMSYDSFVDFRDGSTALESLAGMSPDWSLTLAGDEGPERVTGRFVSASFFDIVGAEPVLGRPIVPADDIPGEPAVVVLSHRFWQSNYGADTEILGQAIDLNRTPVTVVGVMPAGFRFEEPVDLWVPLSWNPLIPRGRSIRWVKGLARLSPETDLEEARAEATTIARRIEAAHPDSSTGLGATLVGLHDHMVAESRAGLWILMGVVGSVLLIACVNVANLLMARAAARESEVAVRAAIGAGRGRLVRQFLTESVMLALAGGAAGLLVAFWGLDLLRTFGPSNLPRLHEVSIDGRVLVFTVAASVITGLLFGIVPTMQIIRRDLHGSLKEGGRFLAGDRGGRTHRLLVVVEVALALVLLIGSGLLIRSFARLMDVDPGFRTGSILTLQIGVPADTYPEPHQRVALYDELFAALESLPGIEMAGGVTRLPMRAQGVTTALTIEGRPTPVGERPEVEFRRASTRYFTTMGIPLVRGRLFNDRDDLEAEPVMIINEAAARRFWPDENPVGRRAKPFNADPDAPWWTIVGVVGDVKHFGLDTEAPAEVYMHFRQGPPRWPRLALHTTGDPASHVAAVRARLRSIETELVIFNVAPMTDLVSASVSTRRFNMVLLGMFAALALLLAALGIYGVLSQAVGHRTHEIGVRMALGAQSRDILRLMIRQGMILTGAGVVAGILSALGLTRLMATLLFGISPTDPVTFVLVVLVLGSVAALACYVPARRAARVDPMTALRYE